MRTGSKYDVLAFEASHFGQAQTGLYRHQEKRVIAPAEPGARIGCGEQRLDLGARERMNQGPPEALARNGEHALDLC